MNSLRPFHVLVCLVLVSLIACSSEKREVNILEKKFREQIEAINSFFKEYKDIPNVEQFTLTIAAPIKVSLNLKENSAITDTEVKMAKMQTPDRQEIVSVRMVWRRYQNGEWEIEYISPQELNETLLMIKQIEQFKKTRQ